MKRVHLVVSGVVQGVGFRYFVREKAQLLGITGRVRNLSDGRVEVFAEGPEADLKELVSFVNAGPSHAKVTAVYEEWSTAVQEWKEFTIDG